mmetsp:Transcript_15543/g.31779  ORF Transcript_15543/g.31779 Transcript_15543/m.31779 type:complete len:227 (+) Transcript_15543:927-1607(+)
MRAAESVVVGLQELGASHDPTVMFALQAGGSGMYGHSQGKGLGYRGVSRVAADGTVGGVVAAGGIDRAIVHGGVRWREGRQRGGWERERVRAIIVAIAMAIALAFAIGPSVGLVGMRHLILGRIRGVVRAFIAVVIVFAAVMMLLFLAFPLFFIVFVFVFSPLVFIVAVVTVFIVSVVAVFLVVFVVVGRGEAPFVPVLGVAAFFVVVFDFLLVIGRGGGLLLLVG